MLDGMKEALKRWLSHGSSGRWLLSGMASHPVRFLFPLLRSLKSSLKLTGRLWPVRVRVGVGQEFNVNCAIDARIEIQGSILVNAWGGSSLPSSITCAGGSTLIVAGDFEIGPGVHIEIGKGGVLKLGGRRDSSASGITCNSRIMVEQCVEIGADSIIAWDVFISGSDWHDISGVPRCSPIVIGNNVWIAHGVSISKGAIVPSGCIVGAKSLVLAGNFQENSLIAGVPAKVRRRDIEWKR